jgi:diguanylate cyclase (GGDEF)-like protein/PAS domain S-box-containing protein
MQAPPVNLVLLGLLVVFFGLQLRRRNEQPYRGWLLGWVLVFFSYVIYYLMPLLPVSYRFVEVARIDTLTLGIVSFLLSFLQRKVGMERTLLLSGLTLGPGLVVIDLQVLLHPTPVWSYEVLAILSGVGAVFVAYRLVPRHWARRRSLLYGLAVVSTACVVAALRTDPNRFLTDAVQVPLLIAVAVLYIASSRSSSLVRGLGGVGFLLWAEEYAFHDLLPHTSSIAQLLDRFWDIPKFFVGMAMILELFEASRRDVERMAGHYRHLYESLDMLYERHPQPMWIYDIQSRQMLSANAAAIQSYGYSLEEMLAMSASALEIEQEPHATESLVHSPPPRTTVDVDSRRLLHRRKNGEIVSVVVTERRQLFEGKDAVVVLAVDVTEQEKLHQELFHRAHHDPLTQLPNRELLADRVAQVIARSQRDSKCAVLLTIDVDHFKQINDTYGHPVGDECLKLVAARLQSRIRSVDTLARTGGEEFTVIIGGLSRIDDAVTVAETLRHLFDLPLLLEDRVLQITISIGGALFPEDGTTLESLRKRSDDALYRAKRAGRNRCVFASTMQEQSL